MSVRRYSFEEIEQLYADIQGLKPRIIIEPDGEAIEMALRSAYIANRAALFCSYNEDMKVLRCEKLKGFNLNANEKQVFKDIGLLLYNCVSNGGRDFMPQKDRDVLESVRLAVAWHLVEQDKEVMRV